MDGANDRYTNSLDIETALDLQAIEREIAQLWHPDARGDDPIPSLATRSSVLNLVIYAPDNETAERMQAASEHISQIHPCRVILFNHVSGSERVRVAPEIYAICDADGEHSAAPCIERIRIPVTGQMYRQLASLVQPLIIPELPAYLWWPATPSINDPAFVALARSSNLTIIDSLRFEATHDLVKLAELEAQLPARAAIGDLNWQRLQPWRELTAQFFDIRSVQWALGCIREVEIDAGITDNRALPVQALMFTSWLAHCLNWTPFEARRTRDDRWYIGMHDQRGEQVRIIIRTRPDAGSWAGHLLSMSMIARNTSGNASSLSLSRSRESSLIRMRAGSETESTLHHAVYHPRLPDEALLLPFLEEPARDHVFDTSLEKAVETIELFGTPEAT